MALDLGPLAHSIPDPYYRPKQVQEIEGDPKNIIEDPYDKQKTLVCPPSPSFLSFFFSFFLKYPLKCLFIQLITYVMI